MTISEPVTLLTDYLLAAWTAVFTFVLWRSSKAARRPGAARCWTAAFAASALAALLGGSWHGFHDQLPRLFDRLLWSATTCAIGLAGLMLLLGALRAILQPPWRDRLARIAIAKFLAYLLIVNLCDSYTLVIAEYATNLLGVMVLSLLRFRRAAFARWSTAGILVAFLAAAVQVSGFTLHARFNHNDLYHVVQALSFWLLYRAGLLLGD